MKIRAMRWIIKKIKRLVKDDEGGEKKRIFITEIKNLRVTCNDGKRAMLCNEVVHPSIVPSLLRSYRYMVALTPFPKNDPKYENPSIVYTNDLSNFTENSVKNPVVPRESHVIYNADPDLVVSPRGEILLFFKNDFEAGKKVKAIGLATSKDGRSWNIVTRDLIRSPTGQSLAAPSVLYDPIDEVFKMWVLEVNWGKRESRIKYLLSSDGLKWQDGGYCLYDLPVYRGSKFLPWHWEVRMIRSTFTNKPYYIILAAMKKEGLRKPINLFFGVSKDGKNWLFDNEALVSVEDLPGSLKIHKPSFFIEEGSLKLLFSAYFKTGWRLFYGEIKALLKDFEMIW